MEKLAQEYDIKADLNDFKYFVRYHNKNDIGTNYYTSLEDAKEDYKKYHCKNYYVTLHYIPQSQGGM